MDWVFGIALRRGFHFLARVQGPDCTEIAVGQATAGCVSGDARASRWAAACFIIVDVSVVRARTRWGIRLWVVVESGGGCGCGPWHRGWGPTRGTDVAATRGVFRELQS